MEQALSYVWSLPVSVLISGMENAEQVNQNAAIARNAGTLDDGTRSKLVAAVEEFSGRDVEFYKNRARDREASHRSSAIPEHVSLASRPRTGDLNLIGGTNSPVVVRSLVATTASRSKLRRIALFVGITWSVAAGFELLQEGGGELLRAGLRTGAIPERWLGPGGAVSAPTVCNPPQAVTPVTAEDQRRVAAADAFRLGSKLGFLASALNAETSATQAVAQETAAVSAMAKALGVPAPVLGPLPPRTERLSVSRRIPCNTTGGASSGRSSGVVSPRHGALFRFGAYSGYALFVRSALPEIGASFVAEMRYYAVRSGVPEELWQPLIGNLSGMSRAQAQQKLMEAMASIQTYLLEGPEKAGPR